MSRHAKLVAAGRLQQLEGLTPPRNFLVHSMFFLPVSQRVRGNKLALGTWRGMPLSDAWGRVALGAQACGPMHIADLHLVIVLSCKS